MFERVSTLSCCPDFNPDLWDDRFFTWENKNVIVESVCTFFYLPMNLNRVLKRIHVLLERNHIKNPDNLYLREYVSFWRMNIYVSVDNYVPCMENRSMCGRFYGKVFREDIQHKVKWLEYFRNRLKEEGYISKQLYRWYPKCTKCIRKGEINYVVYLAQVLPADMYHSIGS